MGILPQGKGQWIEAAFPVAYGLDKLGIGPSAGINAEARAFGAKAPNLTGAPAYDIPGKLGVGGSGGLLSPTDTSGVQGAANDAKALEQMFLAQYGQRSPTPTLRYNSSAPVVYADGAIRPPSAQAQPMPSLPTAQQVANQSPPIAARPDLLPSPPPAMPTAQTVAQNSPPPTFRPELVGAMQAPPPPAAGQQLDPAVLQGLLASANRPQPDPMSMPVGAPSPAAWPARWGV